MGTNNVFPSKGVCEHTCGTGGNIGKTESSGQSIGTDVVEVEHGQMKKMLDKIKDVEKILATVSTEIFAILMKGAH